MRHYLRFIIISSDCFVLRRPEFITNNPYQVVVGNCTLTLTLTMHPFQTRDEHSRESKQVSVIVDHVVEVLMMYSFIWFCLSSSRVVVRVAVLVDTGQKQQKRGEKRKKKKEEEDRREDKGEQQVSQASRSCLSMARARPVRGPCPPSRTELWQHVDAQGQALPIAQNKFLQPPMEQSQALLLVFRVGPSSHAPGK